ncbi:MAG: LPP20 family lipoprotein [Bacteroidetes bacterium]|nr:LPP20 family lipoprotein [Bacteroidota bacterium]
MAKLIFVALCFLVIFTPPSQAQKNKKRPDWVFITPNDGLFYYGMGIVDTEDLPSQYRKIARETAIQEIAEKIIVSIQSESTLQLTSDTENSNYLLKDEIQTRTINYFEDLEMVDDWLDNSSHQYYALYRLDKLSYKSNRRDYIKTVLDFANQHISNAGENFGIGNYQGAFGYLNQALETIAEDQQRLVEMEFSNQLKQLEFQVKSLLLDNLQNVDIKVEQDNFLFNPLKKDPLIIDVVVIDQVPGDNTNSFPLEFQSLKGDVFDYKVIDSEGEIQMKVFGVLPENGRSIVFIRPAIPPRLLQLFADESYQFSYPKSQEITINFKSLPVQITTKETVYGENADPLFFRIFFEDFLAKASVYSVKSGQNVPYKLKIRSKIKKSTKSGKTYVAKLDLWVTINSSKKNRVLFSQTIKDVRGFGMSWEKAADNAYSRSIDMMDEPLNELIQNLCSVGN